MVGNVICYWRKFHYHQRPCSGWPDGSILVHNRKKQRYLRLCSNTGSDNISSYTLSSNGLLNLELPVAGATHKAPTDMTFSGGDQAYLYSLASGAMSIDEFTRNPDGSLTSVGLQSSLPESAVGLVAFK